MRAPPPSQVLGGGAPAAHVRARARVTGHRAGGPRRYTAALVMPKMKSHSGAKKRFKVTGTGKVQARHSFSSHILEKKSPKRKRHMHLDINLVKGDARRATQLLNGQGR